MSDEGHPLHEVDAETLAALRPDRLFDLTGRVAVVTGASGGLGSWFAAGLAAAGAAVVASDHPKTPLDGIVDLVTGAGGVISGAPVDLLDDGAAERIVDLALERHGRIDVVVNNAGVNRREPILDVTDDSWDFIAKLNLKVPFDLSRVAARAMIEAGTGGSIVHIGSLNNAIGLEGVSVYGAHKAGLVQSAKAMAVEWAHHGIRVNALCPGFMLTPLSRPLWNDEVRGAWILRRSPLRRPGYPEELVGTCLLLASDAGSFITGQAIYVDGGWQAGTRWTDELG